MAANWAHEPPLHGRAVLAGGGFPDPHAACRFYASSGTTGQPKLLAHSSASMHSVALRTLAIEPLVRGPNLSMMALSTIGGFGTAQSTLWHGATLVLATVPLMVLRFVNLYRVSALRLSAQQLQALVELVSGRAARFPSLERVEVGGSRTPQSVVLAARATLCTDVVGIYGATETGLVAQAPANLLSADPSVAGYVVPDVQVRIVDDAGQPVPYGEEGHVQVRTPDMARSYPGDPAASARAFRDGWFLPGDVGRLGDDALLRITGRADEMINAGGVKLAPDLLDEFLLSQPGVRDAAAYAYRHPGRADEVWAAVVCAGDFDEQAVLEAARQRLKGRAPVRLVRVARIPRNAMGKPLRQALAEQARQLA